MIKKLLMAGMATALLFSAPLAAAGKKSSSPEENTVKVQIAKLRGRLLYKKSQIRKIEKEVCGSNQQLKDKVTALEKERRTQFVAANSQLEALYAEQDTLEVEIQKLAENKGGSGK